MAKILIIDDEEQLRKLLARIIALEGYEVAEAADCAGGLRMLRRYEPDVVLCDVKLPDGNGVEMVERIKQAMPSAEVILLTAYGNIPDGVQAIKNGAFDYITKGDDNNKILPLLSRATEKAQMQRRLARLEDKLSEEHSFDRIIGSSESLRSAVALAAKTTKTIGNFWVFLTKSVTRILMPLSLVVGILLVINGTPMSFDGKQTITTLEGQEQVISQGPTAAIVPIKQLGTNGGGYFGTNSAHPLENPNAFTNILECWSILILPMAMAFAFGFYTRRRRLAAWIFAVMLFAYIAGVVFSVWQETGGSRQIDRMGIAQELGSMEGKEIRIGSAASAMWGMTTTVTSNGSVDSMHDSQTPLSGMLQMLNMQINCWFGGVGVGWMNYFAFLIIAVFISGLMVGRTPEFLGKKVEAREMKIATLVVLMHPFLILVGTGISAAVAAADPEIGWLNNPSFHGLSEMLYEYTSSAANNGSGFEGLADNTPFWNISTGIALIMGRYFPIVGQVAIAGLLASKKYIPESAGTLKTDTGTFSLMTFAVIIIVAALSFFPALALGPIADYLTF